MGHHSLLQKQMKEHLTNGARLEEIKPLIEAVSSTYNRSEQKRKVLEQSIEFTNQQLIQRNAELNKQVSELSRTKKDLEQSYSLLQASLSSTYDALIMLDEKGSIRLTNANFDQMFEVDAISTGFAHLSDFLDHSQTVVLKNQKFVSAMLSSLAFPEKTFSLEIRTHDGRWIEAYSKAHWHDNEIVGQVWSFRDISALKLKENEAKHRTYHDFLTGLPNRHSLLKRLRTSLNNLKEAQQTLVLFIDLDGFKDVNDSLGQSVGDALLIEVARRLEEQVPRDSVLTRHGGDEFVAIMNRQTDYTSAYEFCNGILSCFAAPFHIGHQDIYMSVSIGIASSDHHSKQSDRLITSANLAMTQAKKKGKNTYELYDSETSSGCEHRMKIRNEINIALKENQFELVFQPKICLESGSIRGAEALIRWRMPDGSSRNPMEFIPIAEESGQIIPISQWVIKRCCEHLNDWMPHLDPDFVLALNISAKHFQKGLLQSDVAAVLKDVKTIPSMLELEVTETAIMDDIELAVSTLNELKKLGIRTAIDDFGTGHSSLSYLRKLPIEVLKIDKSFIDEIISSNEDRTLVKGIIDMVHALGIDVVAEGVENHQMAVLLQNMNCDLVQGYHYCKPIPECDFIELIRARLCYI